MYTFSMSVAGLKGLVEALKLVGKNGTGLIGRV
jgi:hypothetical protein